MASQQLLDQHWSSTSTALLLHSSSPYQLLPVCMSSLLNPLDAPTVAFLSIDHIGYFQPFITFLNPLQSLISKNSILEFPSEPHPRVSACPLSASTWTLHGRQAVLEPCSSLFRLAFASPLLFPLVVPSPPSLGPQEWPLPPLRTCQKASPFLAGSAKSAQPRFRPPGLQCLGSH